MGNIIRGKDLNLFYTLNGYNYPACHSTDCKLTLNSSPQETTTKNSKNGRTYEYQGKYGFTLSLKGITNLIDIASVSVFQDAIIQSNKLQFIFTDSLNIQWSGTVLINQIDLDSPVENLSTFSNDMVGDGDIVKIASGVIPPISNPIVSIIDQTGYHIADVSAPGTYSVLRFDTIDEGSALTVEANYQIVIIQAA
jgi:hypothetical protein